MLARPQAVWSEKRRESSMVAVASADNHFSKVTCNKCCTSVNNTNTYTYKSNKIVLITMKTVQIKIVKYSKQVCVGKRTKIY